MAVQCSSGSAFPLRPFFQQCRVEPAEFEGTGRGMCCTEPVRCGEEMLRIPLHMCWTAEAARRCPELATLGEELLEAISDASLIALHMLVVRAQGAQATDACRREHVAVLSSAEFETMLDWGEDDLKMLTGSKWAMVAPACRQDMEDEFDELQDMLAEFFHRFSIDKNGFLWAHKLLISRSVGFFSEGEGYELVLGPGQDMFNHSVDAPVRGEDVVLRGEGEDRALVIQAFRDFAAGEEALYSYSAACNGRLLMMGGFVLPENPFDAVELAFTFDTSPASSPLFHALASGLHAGLPTSGAAAAEETRDEFLEDLPETQQVRLHMRLGARDLPGQLARAQAFFKLTQLCRGGAAPSQERLEACDQDPSDPMNAQARETLERTLAAVLAGYPSSLEEDEAALPGADKEAGAVAGLAPDAGVLHARRRASCLRVLIGEKRIYSMALLYLASQRE